MKKYFVILTALVLALSAVVFAVTAEPQESTSAVWCDRCNEYVPAEEWTVWDTTGGDLNQEGHYYLADTYTTQTATVNIPALKFVCLDLRGNTWISEGLRTLTVSGDFSIIDSVGGGMILTTGEHLSQGAFATVAKVGALNIYGGTIQRIVRDDIKIYQGGLIDIAGGTVNLYGGTVTGGVVEGVTVNGSTKVPRGGNIYMTGGSLGIYGGTLSNGMAVLGASTNAQGGNVYATEDASLNPARITISSGKISDGYSAWDGGNLYISIANLTLADTGVITGGHAVRHGGNMEMSSEKSGVYLLGGSMTDGVAGGTIPSSNTSQGGGGGGNIFGYMGTLEIADCTISGDVRLGADMTSIKLSGITRIGLGTCAGLFLTKGMTIDVSELEDGSEIFVRTYGGAFTKEIPADKLESIYSYFKGAVRTSVTMDATANTINAAQGTTGYCPHCYDPENPQEVTWSALSSNEFKTAGHYYLTKSQVGESNYVFYTDCVFDLNGYALQRTARRTILSGVGVSLTVMDSCGGGRVIGVGTHESNNKYTSGIQFASENQTFTLLSGSMIMDTAADACQVLGGGLFHSYSANTKIYIKGGVISGGVLKAESTTGGGNIYLSKNDAVLEISGGIIKNGNSGTTASGGNIYTAGKVTVSGGVIIGGTGKYGGNIYTTNEIAMTGGIIWGGTGASGVGNIYTKKATISGGVIACGKATGNGGNIRVSEVNSTISGNAVIHSGKATGSGGNLICIEKMTLSIEGGLIAGGVADLGGNLRQNSGDAKININGGLVAMGKASNGGNAYINNGTLNMTGGVVTAGTAAKGGNFYFNYNTNASFCDDGDITTAIPVVSYGTATGGNGGNIAFIAGGNTADASKYTMTLGNCAVYNGSASGSGDNMYINQYAKVAVLPEFDQRSTIYFHDSLIANDIYLDNNYVTCEGVYSGELLLENRSNLPKIVTTLADNSLAIGQAALVMHSGVVEWYSSNAAAMEDYNDTVAYIQPGSGELVLPAGTFVIDLVGQNITVTGPSDAKVYCFDSANNSFNAFGTAEFSGPSLMNANNYAQDGAIYVTVAESDADTYSFHYLNMRVSSVSFRASSAGIYYRCTWECDDVLKSEITDFGVAVSVFDMPGADFATDEDTLYTANSATDLTFGKEYYSVLIDGIFDESAENNASRGNTPIYATPYVILQNGESLVCPAEFKHSLKTVLKMIDNRGYYANKATLEEFYQKWENAMQKWGFANIGVKPQEDDTIRILMIGNSFCSYYVQELYGLLYETRPAGVERVEVYNLYYSGRGMTAHYNLWKNNSPGDYDLFKMDENGRNKLQPSGGWTLEEALAVGNWDYISMQGKPTTGSYTEGQEGWDTMCAALEPLAEALFGHIHEMFPYTQLLWHRTWNQEVGRVTDSGFVYTEEYNARYDPGMQYVCDWMTEVFDQDKPYDLIQVNSGAAWTEARRLNDEMIAAGGEGVLPYGGLCAMLARNTFGDQRPGSGDGQHDGDIGGGQLLNAYMWYMTITGDSDLSDNMFKPDYEMSDELWNMLKQAAMTVYAADHAE